MAKRVIFLTRIHIILFALSLLALISRWDSFDLRADMRALDWIEAVNELQYMNSSYGDEWGDLADPPLWNVNARALEWLQQDPLMWEPHRQVRDEVTQLLTEHGIDDTILASVKGRSSPEQPNYFTLMEVELDETLRSGPSLSVADYTVRELTERYLLLTEPLTMHVATELKTRELPSYAAYQASNEGASEATTEEAAWYQDEPVVVLSSVSLRGNVATVVFAEDYSTYVGQSGPLSIHDELLVVTQTIQAPSLFELMTTLNGEDHAQMAELRGKVDRLNEIYGNLKLALAQSIVAEDFTHSYRSIDLLGFTVSTRRFPFAILVLSFLAAWGIAWTVEYANRGGKRILSEVHDDVIDIFIDVPEMRIIVWALLPPLSILASLPAFPLGTNEQAVMWAGLGVVTLMGAVAVVRARKL